MKYRIVTFVAPEEIDLKDFDQWLASQKFFQNRFTATEENLEDIEFLQKAFDGLAGVVYDKQFKQERVKELARRHSDRRAAIQAAGGGA